MDVPHEHYRVAKGSRVYALRFAVHEMVSGETEVRYDQQPLVEEAARLPSFRLLTNDSNLSTQLSTHAGFVSGQVVSPTGATSHSEPTLEVADDVAFRREKTAGVNSGGFFKMERAKRLELSLHFCN